MPSGRLQILDDQKKAEICALVTAGCSRAVAARYVGCCVRTIGNAARGDPRFRTELRRAAAAAELNALAEVRKAAKTSWRAAVWFLAQRRPDEYGPPPRNNLMQMAASELQRPLE